ncbi:MAG: NADH-quinone oxidoreductase subunit NuoG [Candidatus Eisenbacteria bacterium]|nr:NADH-quinone oxidoreductase subunit NuoG [Candidatus Eisenbacteria bacterium]
MSKLVKVTIDGRTVEVPAGTLVTDASRAAEVHVPIFCSHSKLPPLGACRICVVEVGMPKLDANRQPVMAADGTPEIAWMPKVQTGCTTTVADGMHVRTASNVATKARKGVMEFLLVNHPLDCPVCDEGGECQLQDLAFAFGHDHSRMDEAKRTFDSEDLGPIVKKEANRCIVCMRCVRYCDEVMGENALTAHQRGVHTEISSFDRQPLACEQCGNCVEVCPVGALTALPYRFKARPWDLRQHITICEWCPNGCSVRLGVRGMEILRARGTEFRGVNQEYLCVRGRFGHDFVNAADRLTAPLVRTGAALQPSTQEEAVTYAAARLRDIAATHGPDSIAFVGGEKLNVEEQFLFQKLARHVLGSTNVDARTRVAAAVSGSAVLRATGGGRPGLTFQGLYEAKEVLVLFEDLQGEAPLAQAAIVRGFRQRGLHVTVAHARRVKLARPKFKGDHLAVKPGAELALTLALTRAALDLGMPEAVPAEVSSALGALQGSLASWTGDKVQNETGVSAAAVAAAAKRMREAGAKALLFGRGVLEHAQAPALVQAIENLAWALGAITAEQSSVMAFGPHHDSAGALEIGLSHDTLPGHANAPKRGLSAREAIAAAAEGKVRALWIVSDDLIASAPDRALVEKAFEKCELVIVNELFLTRTAARAHVVFPVAAFAEKEGSVVNSERRLQKSNRALSPRKGARADWDVFQSVAQALGADWRYRTSEDVFREIARTVPGFAGLSYATLLPDGALLTGTPIAASIKAVEAAPLAGEGLALLSGGTLFADGSLSSRSATLAKLAGGVRARLAPAEASRLGLVAGDRVELTGPAGPAVFAVEIDDSVPAGAVFVPAAGAELNRLGVPSGGGLRVSARKSASAATVGA